MKIEISFLAGIFLVGSDLLARAAVQGVEPALVATAIEYGSKIARRVSTRMRAGTNLCFTNESSAT
jgi:hypothetical protein